MSEPRDEARATTGKSAENLQKTRLLRSESTKFQDHVAPPIVGALKRGSANTKMRTVKAIAESILINKCSDEKRMKDEVDKHGQWKHSTMGIIEFFVYKILLVGLYIAYGIFRYFQYQYNLMKLRILNVFYSPSNTPQLIRQDVRKLNKIPKVLASILEVKPVGDVGGGSKGLLNDGSKLVCWTVSAGIKQLILYDYEGILQGNVELFREGIYAKLSKYYGPYNVPTFAVKVPHENKVYYNLKGNSQKKSKVSIEVSLLSSRDGRETIVDLTKTMAHLYKQGDLSLDEITVDLVDQELVQLVGHEPDLLLYFGPALDLQGYPPWHLRLTEFFWEADNNQVTYSVFIRGLRVYAGAQMNVGK
ncbi:ditrans,polycis-polyprenyl diphosphate synthase KNAG_0B02820 [Huiozyma naganishii CBS 8797]|uniref:ditrans,polycis-polyprenyl diphosphate synthase [(2E,6E)-farnesyldiphosphate specific] n=1 Tax=Huiozyma naganishii (strain ATCC MYA-139 / BCRC 22969 / CBS 8797 / KCTC 17520 / NBRC 10181 / NCYC 3082 / Yp74L-3) TaxID=1071383 RepID=J7S3H0_HUIN7|nr:hypothetical protein KNAG_0B02820 [Kazachstania naganishii CBS 8797]CCK68724.1 hypothetical protein KNAG_0B02820 [Kazachstania naganishii CBS 8797]